ncbi:Hypothetical predicted protein [Olea europaea subsp. europaea]|uniref:Uncharacterized protein n=1 Tax=Olea europaea subsp. europaea TaxID=158383 RepID=A0A8S0U9N2_OLEEU|nr:Hypothetical predicted protein [Olea europaea subsp. europaea]
MGLVEEAHNVKIVGSGDQTIVLAHEFGTDQPIWKHLVPHLVEENRVIVFDNMGVGTTKPDYFDFERYSSLEGYAYDVFAILKELQAWCDGFAPLVIGGDMETLAVQGFSRTSYNMRPDIALSMVQTIFQSDMWHLLCHVTIPCHIIQSMKNLAILVVIFEYIHQNIDSKSIVEMMQTNGHLPQLSLLDVVTPVLLRHIRYSIAS